MRLPTIPEIPGRVKRALLLLLCAALGALGAVLYFAFTLNTPLENLAVAREVPPTGDPAFVDLVALNTDMHFDPGHQVQIRLDGEQTYDQLWSDIRSARRSLTLQLYFCKPGALADSLAAALAVPARAGVPVLFLYDGFACDDLGDAYFDGLRAAGVDARSFRPVKWWDLHRAQQRSHARIVVIDGRLAWTGGFGIDDRWSAEGTAREPGWRETNVRFTGPAVAWAQAAFTDGWAETAGELLVGDAFYPTLPDVAPHAESPDSGVFAGFMHSTPDEGSTTAERLLALTIASARRTLYISNAYFVPDDDFRGLLVDAAGRGVDVRVLAPDEDTDVPVVRYAAWAHYDELLDGGVRVFEYRPRMMHAKTLVADGRWVAIGSMNFDNRSLAVNEEVTFLALDEPMGAAMDSIFLADLEHAMEVTPRTLEDRSFWHRVKESIAVLASRVL